jgi:hypothetical protein
MRMMREDALAVAQVVEEAFAGHSELDDDLIDPQVRSVFYDLQDQHILNIERREYQSEGRSLRGFFWKVDATEPQLDRWAPGAARDETTELYDRLGDVAWQRRDAPQ